MPCCPSHVSPLQPEVQPGLTAVRTWDSTFFGVRIAEVKPDRGSVDLAAAVQRADEDDVECLYFLADAEDHDRVRAAEAEGFGLVGIRLTLARETGSGATVATDSRVRVARSDDVPVLVPLARRSHRNTRFYRDPRFDRARVDDMYGIWIERSVHGELADAVFVAEVRERPSGYLTIAREADAAVIGLVAVDESVRGQGIGSALLCAALRWAADAGLPRVSVVTQGHTPAAIRFYERGGFEATLVQLWYHRWRAAGGAGS